MAQTWAEYLEYFWGPLEWEDVKHRVTNIEGLGPVWYLNLGQSKALAESTARFARDAGVENIVVLAPGERGNHCEWLVIQDTTAGQYNGLLD